MRILKTEEQISSIYELRDLSQKDRERLVRSFNKAKKRIKKDKYYHPIESQTRIADGLNPIGVDEKDIPLDDRNFFISGESYQGHLDSLILFYGEKFEDEEINDNEVKMFMRARKIRLEKEETLYLIRKYNIYREGMKRLVLQRPYFSKKVLLAHEDKDLDILYGDGTKESKKRSYALLDLLNKNLSKIKNTYKKLKKTTSNIKKRELEKEIKNHKRESYKLLNEILVSGRTDFILGKIIKQGLEELESGNYSLNTYESKQEEKLKNALLTKRLEIYQNTRNQIILGNLGLVVAAASHFFPYRRGTISISDMLAEGVFGLSRAISGFDANKGNSFSTYAFCWIEREIQRLFMGYSMQFRLPQDVYNIIPKIRKIINRKQNETGFNPTTKEIAKEVNLSVETTEAILKTMKSPVFLDALVEFFEDEGPTKKDIFPNKEMNQFEKIAIRNELKRMVEKKLLNLDTRGRGVIKLLFGIGCNPHTLEEAGKKFNLTRERIRQIKEDALKKLIHPTNSRGLESFLD